MFQENAGKSCENCSKTGLIGTFWDTNDGGRTSGNNSNPAEAESLFELFYRKTAPLCFINVVMTGLIEKSICGVFLKKRKSFNKNIYPGSLFRHRFSHKPVSFSAYKALQIEPAICTPASDGVVVRYRNAHTHPRFFENLPRRNSPFDMLLPA